jgi:hypothetical protein
MPSLLPTYTWVASTTAPATIASPVRARHLGTRVAGKDEGDRPVWAMSPRQVGHVSGVARGSVAPTADAPQHVAATTPHIRQRMDPPADANPAPVPLLP